MLKQLLLAATLLALAAPAFAQATKEEKLKEKAELDKLDEGWTKKAAVGLGLDQLALINPRVGAGNDQLGFRGVLAASATYRKGRIAWDNVGTAQFGIQKIGTGIGANLADIPFTKSVDNLALASKFGYGITDNGVLFYSVGAAFRSQLTPTYTGNLLTLSPLASTNAIISDFLSPGLLSVAPGIDYKPNAEVSVLFSPATARFLMVLNNDIAQLGTLGNPVTRDANNNVTSYKNTDFQLGASLTASYKHAFLDNKIQFQTGLNLFSNYLRDPQNIDVDWSTVSKVNLYKGLGLTLNTNLYYDNDIDVYARQKNAQDMGSGTKPGVAIPAGYKLTRNVQFIEGLSISYDRTF